MEAKWQKNHSGMMELAEKKAKLLADIELLAKERNELSETLTEIHKKLYVNRDDWKEIEAERLKTLQDMDDKFVSLNISSEKENEERVRLLNELNNLNKAIELAKLEKNTTETVKEKSKKDAEILLGLLNEQKIEWQDTEKEKRETLKKLKDEIDEIGEKLRENKDKIKEEDERILKENRLIAIRRSDLQIYEQRMKKKYPSETFVLENDFTSKVAN